MIHRRVLVPAGADRLWRALTDPDETSTWLGGRLEWVPEEGSDLRFWPGEAGTDPRSYGPREGRVEEVVPGRYVRFVWWPALGGPGEASEVAYTLEPMVTDGSSGSTPEQITILTVEEAPAPVAPDPVGRASASVVGTGWTTADSLQLKAWAAAHRPAGALLAH